MDEDLAKLTTRLGKLRVRRTETIKELQVIEKEHEEVETLIKQASGLIGVDSRGVTIHAGDKVTTLTRGKYYERIAKVTLVKPDNHIVIKYLVSAKSTWRKGYNLLILNE